MNLRALATILSVLLGMCLLLLGASWAYMAASGAVKSSAIENCVVVGGFLLAATPCLVFPFSTRLAKVLLVVYLLATAVCMLFLAFQPNLPAKHPAGIQLAAITLVVLLIARIALTMRRRSSR